MANSLKFASIIAKEAVMILENELVMKDKVYRGYEQEYAKSINGYKIGDTLTIRRPTHFQVNDGPVAVVQDKAASRSSSTSGSYVLPALLSLLAERLMWLRWGAQKMAHHFLEFWVFCRIGFYPHGKPSWSPNKD
jgi:hypothetical protein